MAETYELTGYADGGAVKSALDKAESALQAADVADKVAGPASATDNAIARFDGETGKLLQDGANATLADNGALTIATGAVTDSQPVLNLSQTWNDAADTFTGIKANVTDTASAADSLLMDLRVGGSSIFRLDKRGFSYYKSSKIGCPENNAIEFYSGSNFFAGLQRHDFHSIPPTAAYTWGTANYTNTLYLCRDAADTLAQRNGTNAQESRLYGSFTSATAYQRLATKTIREAVTCAAGASVTTTISIPKYTHLIGVTTRVTTAIGTTNSTTGYQVGDGTDADLWGAITGTAQGTTSDRRDFTAVDALGPDGADRTITLTAVGGNFDGTGVIEVCAYYLAAEAD